MVFITLQTRVPHQSREAQSAPQAMQYIYLCYCTELEKITHSAIITTWSSVQWPGVWNSVLPKSDNPCNCLALFIHYAELLSYYCMVCCCGIDACPTHSGCCYEYRGIWQILEFELHFCVLILANFCIHVEHIQMICKNLCEPPLQLTNLAWQRTKYHRRV
jgi:hypothetical protein